MGQVAMGEVCVWGGSPLYNRLGVQPWALSLPDKELCLREALAVCTPPAPELREDNS